jgi:arginase
MGKTIKLIKEVGHWCCTRGSDLGIDKNAVIKNSDFFNQFEFEDVKTHNESIYDKTVVHQQKDLSTL